MKYNVDLYASVRPHLVDTLHIEADTVEDAIHQANQDERVVRGHVYLHNIAVAPTPPTQKPFIVLLDTGGRPYGIGGETQVRYEFDRESEAWSTFWGHVAGMADDGVQMKGLDERYVLESRTGLNPNTGGSAWAGHRWYVHIMKGKP